MTKLCFAILAHNEPDCLKDLVVNLRAFAPGSDIVVYNGGRDQGLVDGLPVDVCPYSRPLAYERVARFHGDMMQWLHESQRRYDYLVTLDSDVLLIKPGLDQYLPRIMGDSAYMAVWLREVHPTTPWIVGQRFLLKWESIWQPIFDVANPIGCFNPCQVFRQDYADKFMRFPKRQLLMERIERSSLRDLEEMIWSTLAATLDCAPARYPFPAETAVRYLRRHSAQEMQRWVNNPDVFFVHPITMQLDAPERRLVRALRNGQALDLTGYQAAFDQYNVGPPLHKRLRQSMMTPILSNLHTAYLRIVPE
jgi:hypothetical protein